MPQWPVQARTARTGCCVAQEVRTGARTLWHCRSIGEAGAGGFAENMRVVERMKMDDEPSVHDNDVYAVTVDCPGRRLILHTSFENPKRPEFTDIVFHDVVAHQLEHVLPGNILLGIEETDPEPIVRERAALFQTSWQYGWPPIEYDGDLEVLVAALQAQSVRGYSIDSSYGLSGWVLAGRCELRPRAEAARMD